MAYAIGDGTVAAGSGRDDLLLDGFRRTRVYMESSPREQADLESFLSDLRSTNQVWSFDRRKPACTNGQ